MTAHTHDDVDWASRLPALRRADVLERSALDAVADRLTTDLGAAATVIDIGSGSGGMSAALAAALRRRGGGTLVLLDAVDELLAAASATVRAELAEHDGPPVRVETVVADAGSPALADLVPPADLIWASHVVHHLPDQQTALGRLAALLRDGGRLAVAEGGLDARCLPWDLGVGEPGLEDRLTAARAAWFARLRADIPDAVRMPYGWASALHRAGLAQITSFSYLVDHPAPTTPPVRDYVLERMSWLADVGDELLAPGDRDAVRLLLDPDAPEYLGARDDLYLLSARTVHTGRRA
ncbi:Methyltransferase domain-containing protein [Amycolatopsis arida]|uniref:Methyltransferase domain-containing protein n=1 Tax=Amycolatopsis arida TaxID=587909 RepID=A0A1I5MMU8_9PSEU|nr:class I SAM-dependent methyltransferase [Amycolatopsis arida]TDX94142.1 methyltransferase family protein [Amycolatopsis arida]SFP10922.1 Methyltransferase domain-containing protein [Amycolatopsis arida]